VQETFRSALCPIDGVGSVLEGLKIPHCVASSSALDRVSLSLSLTGLARTSATGSIPRRWWTAASLRPISSLYAAERMQADPARTS